MGDNTPALVVEDLHKKFGALEVLKGISLSARDGDVIAMIGSSGSGKSTFLRCINLLETPDSGRVYVAGELIKMRTAKTGHAMPVREHFSALSIGVNFLSSLLTTNSVVCRILRPHATC